MQNQIEELKKRKNALLLAHYYTLPEVQQVADYVGDSLALARRAAQTDADIILFAGVHFMAETAKILNPGKKVLIPDLSAGCSLADSCDASLLEKFIQEHPQHLVVSYINCSAAVKAMSDLIVTSGNALKIINSLPKDEKIIFAPDRNLGRYVNQQTGRNMLLWDGACHVHDKFAEADVLQLKQQHPAVPVLAHPECNETVLRHADFTGSTAAMLREVQQSDCKEFIIITEEGFLYELQQKNPSKIFYAPKAKCLQCQYMKQNNPSNILHALETESPELQLPGDLIDKAKLPILKMLELSK